MLSLVLLLIRLEKFFKHERYSDLNSEEKDFFNRSVRNCREIKHSVIHILAVNFEFLATNRKFSVEKRMQRSVIKKYDSD